MDPHGGDRLSLGRIVPIFVIVLLLASFIGDDARGQTDEERYVLEIVPLLIEANVHLGNATDALGDCLANFSSCLNDPSAVVQRLNESRDGLIGVRASVQVLVVPGRYQLVNDLSIDGISHSIDGTALHIEGLEEKSVVKFESGSNLTAQGRDEMQQAIDLLEVTPPRTALEELLMIVVVVVAVSVASSVGLLIWWSRRGRTRPPAARPPERV